MYNVFEAVKDLDKHRCRYWGCSSGNIEVHHIIPRSQGGPDKIWNLICLCPEHHRMITDRKITDVELLTALESQSYFRWGQALIWHVVRDELRKIRMKRGK